LENIKKTHGIFLISGPTGSGKSTTLYSILSMLNTNLVNIVTLEDPVEYFIPGVNQSQINPDIGLTFAAGLRSILRQDPNVIMVGEIRDKETAELAVHAALTGHLVFSTLHTNDAIGAMPRLIDMDIEPFLLASQIL
jgi:type IV pilus assembly protein PilB